MISIPSLCRRCQKLLEQLLRAAGDKWWMALLFAAVAMFLVIDPAMWLVETWEDSGYDSAGGHFFAVAVGICVWSLTSPVRDDADPPTVPWEWIGVAAVLRLAGHMLALSYLGALAIPIGVYSLARLAGLHLRRRAVSPCWLAVLVGLTLPVEYVVKRLVGYGLQHLAANGACSLLGVVYDDITCTGLDIALRGHELFIDLSCSGARTLLLYSIVFAGLAAVVRPGARQAAAGFGLALLAGITVNSLRIALLAAGLAHEPSLGFDVMEHPWHMGVGLACLPVGLIPLVVWAGWVHRTPSAGDDTRSRRAPTTSCGQRAAVIFLSVAVAIAVCFSPQFPLHTADGADAIDLPPHLADHSEQPRTPGPVARRYFERYGGGIAIADYGPHTLVVVETKTPLRHLHSPDQWLGDAGFTVERIGHTPGVIPAATYRVDGPDAPVRRLDVTYISDGGRVATGTAEAIWYWLSAPETTWRAYLRFHPLETPPNRLAAVDRQIIRSFQVPDGPGADTHH